MYLKKITLEGNKAVKSILQFITKYLWGCSKHDRLSVSFVSICHFFMNARALFSNTALVLHTRKTKTEQGHI